MKRILSPIINLVSLILVGVAFGLAGITAATQANKAASPAGSYYQLVWQNPKALPIIGFFLLCVGAFVLLFVFIPKIRKFVAPVGGLMVAGAGVLALLTPKAINPSLTNKPALIAMAVLLFVAAAFEIVITVLEFLDKE